MSTVLQIDSFPSNIIRERTSLASVADPGTTVINLESSANFNQGDILYVGNLGRETCEKAVVASVDTETAITLSSALGLAHAASEPVTKVMGDKIKIYRALNMDGSVPASDAFTVLATRETDADSTSTYYRDSSGSSAYWYCYTYFNETTLEETERSTPFRGDDFGHYASISEIRREAGFDNNYNVSDTYINQKRRAAESEVNTSLSNTYTTPFTPVPDFVRTVSIALTVGLIWEDQYGSNSQKAKGKLGDARGMLTNLQNRSSDITGTDGVSLAAERISSWPDATTEARDRLNECDGHIFHIGDVF